METGQRRFFLTRPSFDVEPSDYSRYVRLRNTRNLGEAMICGSAVLSFMATLKMNRNKHENNNLFFLRNDK